MFSRILLFLPKIGISKLNIETLNGKKRVLLKMCKFPLTGRLPKICNFFRKTCAIRFFMSKAFQKAKFYQNLTSERGQYKDSVCYRKKQSFRHCA